MANQLKKNTASKAKKKQASETDGVQKYFCTSCGRGFIRQKDNFNVSPSPMYKGNGHFLTVCKNCLKEMFDDFTENIFDGNQDEAAELICSITNTCFDKTAWANAKKVPVTRSRISAYFSKLNLGQTKGASYVDTVIFQRENQIENILSIQQVQDDPDCTVSVETVRLFGIGFLEQEYETLKYEYDDWVAKYGSPEDKRQEELYKSICYLKLQLQKSVQNGDAGVGALAKAYKDYINAATTEIEDRRQKKEDSVRLDPLGVWIGEIEKHTPAEFYKEKPLYSDFDGIGRYANRFIFRPLKNLLTGSKELDKEFNLSDKED